jgi:anti-anti-sigma factor
VRIVRRDVDGVAVLGLAEPGEIDLATSEAFRAGLLEASGTSDRVVLDCSLLEFLDSAGMSALLTLRREIVLQRRGRLTLACVNRPIQDILRMVGFDAVFPWYPDVPQALAALRG